VNGDPRPFVGVHADLQAAALIGIVDGQTIVGVIGTKDDSHLPFGIEHRGGGLIVFGNADEQPRRSQTRSWSRR